MESIMDDFRAEGELTGLVSRHPVQDAEPEIQTEADISVIGGEIGQRIIPIFTDAGKYESVPHVTVNSPHWRNLPA